jgi:hypothetical protein
MVIANILAGNNFTDSCLDNYHATFAAYHFRHGFFGLEADKHIPRPPETSHD